jgi:ubiquinone/menaquinone biosynthesis C-methylase UbiE
MLAQARAKNLPQVTWVQRDPPQLSSIVQGPFGGVVMAYGLRNLPDPDAALAQLHALLEPGGHLVLQDYCLADAEAEKRWRWMSRGFIVPLCSAISRAPALFAYLEQSVLAFDRLGELAVRLEKAGFQCRRVLPGRGWQKDIVHTFVLSKSQ